MNQTLNDKNSKWLNMSLQNSKDVFYAIRLSGLMIKHQDLIEQAINGKLDEAGKQKVVTWLIGNLPKTDNAQSDSMVLETAWMIYAISVYQDPKSDAEADRETDFLTDVRAQYLAARLNAGKDL